MNESALHVLIICKFIDHGEINDIRKACKILGTYDLSGYDLYTNAIPCPMCLSAIIWEFELISKYFINFIFS